MSVGRMSSTRGLGGGDLASSVEGESRPAVLRAIFDSVADLPSAEVAAAIRSRCGGDDQLAAEVLALVQGDRRAAGLLDDPAAAIGLGDAGRNAAELVKIPGFATLSLLGEGGFARVYVAEQLATRRKVALKVMAASIASESARDRFDREVQVLAGFDHPGIARLFEAGVYAGPDGVETPYFAMEMVNGSPLTRYARWAGLETRGILQLMAEVADAVGHAHAQGIVHRDLKPANILVDMHGRPKVLDFGLALARPDQGSASGLSQEAGGPETPGPAGAGGVGGVGGAGGAGGGMSGPALNARLVGTIAYMAPEQLAGDVAAICRATDVYALGVMLYEMLSGSHPLQLADLLPHEAVVRAARQALPPLGSLNPRFRGDVCAMVSKATARRAEDRYASAADLRDDLIRHLNLRPTLARPLPAYARAARFMNRHRLLSGAAALVLLCGGAALAALYQAEVQAQRGRQLAERTARDTINTVLEGLSGVAGAIEPRARLLEQLLRNTEHFERVLPHDRDAMLTRARVLEGMGDLLHESGMFAATKANRERALEIIQRLVDRLPEDAELQAYLSIAIVKHGDVMGEMGMTAAAEERYREAMEIDERLHEMEPERRWFADNLCYSYERVGMLHVYRNEWAKGEELFRKRLALAEELLARNPAEEKSIRNLGFAHAYMAMAHTAGRRWDEAREAGRRAIDLFNSLWERRPANRDAIRDLIMANGVYSDALLRQTAFNPEAWPSLARAAELADSLYLAEEHSPQVAGILLDAHVKLAEYLLGVQEVEDAARAARRVLAVGENLRQRGTGDATAAALSPEVWTARAQAVLDLIERAGEGSQLEPASAMPMPPPRGTVPMIRLFPAKPRQTNEPAPSGPGGQR